MQNSDRKRFAGIMTAIAEYYKDPISDGVIEMYWQGLRDLEIAAIEQAVWQHTRSPDAGQWRPKVGDIRRMLGGTSADGALVAWSRVDKAVRRIGTYATVVFDDALVHRVIDDMGGWVSLGRKSEDEWPFVAKEFENRYRGYASRGERPEYPAMLIGIAQGANESLGMPVAPPVMLGDPDRCAEVLRCAPERYDALRQTSAIGKSAARQITKASR